MTTAEENTNFATRGFGLEISQFQNSYILQTFWNGYYVMMKLKFESRFLVKLKQVKVLYATVQRTFSSVLNFHQVQRGKGGRGLKVAFLLI